MLKKYSYSKFLNLSNRSCSQLEHYEDTIRELNLKMTSLQGDRDQKEHEVRIVSRHRLMEWTLCLIQTHKLNWVSKLMRLMHWFCYTSLRDWSRNLVPPSQPIKCRTKTSYDLVARAFPRFREFSFFLLLVLICWPLSLVGFCFYVSQSENALIGY